MSIKFVPAQQAIFGEPGIPPRLSEAKFSWRANGLPALELSGVTSPPAPTAVACFPPSVLSRTRPLPSRNLTVPPALRANLARSAQDFLEELVLQLVANFQESTGARSLCLAGGVFLNVLLVRALETRGPFDHVYVQPVAGECRHRRSAQPIFSRKKITRYRSGRGPLPSLAVGVHSSSQEIKAVLDNCKIAYRYLSGEDQTLEETAALLHRDKIVAWCQGRSEFGHRALGNRSLLASPFSEYVIENVNQFIKHREGFSPVCPLRAHRTRFRVLRRLKPNCLTMSSACHAAGNRSPASNVSRFTARKCAFTRSTSEPTRSSGSSSTNSANPLLPLSWSTPRSIFLASPSSPTPVAPSAVSTAPASTPSPSAPSSSSNNFGRASRPPRVSS